MLCFAPLSVAPLRVTQLASHMLNQGCARFVVVFAARVLIGTDWTIVRLRPCRQPLRLQLQAAAAVSAGLVICWLCNNRIGLRTCWLVEFCCLIFVLLNCAADRSAGSLVSGC